MQLIPRSESKVKVYIYLIKLRITERKPLVYIKKICA